MNTSASLLAQQRQDRIRADLIARGTVRTADLAADFGVSTVTIRRDLAALELLGEAIVIHGGARSFGRHAPPADRRDRTDVQVAAKQAIARAAVGLIQQGDAIFLDSGTTCAAMVTGISELAGVTVVTTDLNTATALAVSAPHVSVVMAGGVVDPMTLSAVGELLPSVLRYFVFDVAFISTTSWSLDAGATTGALSYAAVKKSALERAKRSVLVADSSKYGPAQTYVIQPLVQFSSIITDDGVAPEHRNALNLAGINLISASS
ncbi:MAG: DeoR/GlpR family DNA-binding transcription regulator [Mycetocola sp.]